VDTSRELGTIAAMTSRSSVLLFCPTLFVPGCDDGSEGPSDAGAIDGDMSMDAGRTDAGASTDGGADGAMCVRDTSGAYAYIANS
jgi:hypothetical protein